MNPIFLNDWSPQYVDDPLNQLMSDFQINEETLQGVNIIFASYTYQNYSGDAFVLFEKDGKLYEVNGSHCSCYGLEGQWQPGEVYWKELKNRIKTHHCFEGCRDVLQEMIMKTEIDELIKQFKGEDNNEE